MNQIQTIGYKLIDNIEKVIIGKHDTVTLAAIGHPGGETEIARFVAVEPDLDPVVAAHDEHGLLLLV